MDILGLIAITIGVVGLLFFIVFLMRKPQKDSSDKPQEEVKEIKQTEQEKTKEMKHPVPDAEYNWLIKLYGYTAVYLAELKYDQLFRDGCIESSLSFFDMCEEQEEKLRERAEKLREQEAEIKRVKSLSKEELELYLLQKLQEEAIKRIKSK